VSHYALKRLNLTEGSFAYSLITALDENWWQLSRLVASLLHFTRLYFRILDSVSCIYTKEMMLSQEELIPAQVIHKEKKKVCTMQ
jgi:hypothetical protein